MTMTKIQSKDFPQLAALIAALPQAALAQTAVADPQGSGPIVNALNWMQGTLLGNVATTAAVIAVAVVGMMMLTGRMNWRFGSNCHRWLLRPVRRDCHCFGDPRRRNRGLINDPAKPHTCFSCSDPAADVCGRDL